MLRKFRIAILVCGLSLAVTSFADNKAESLQLNERAVALANNSEYAKAEETFKQALKMDPHNVTAAYNLAGVYTMQQKMGLASALLEDYVERVPNDPNLYARLGDIYFSGQELREALRNYLQALKLAPHYKKLNQKVATIYTLQENLVEAERYLTKASKEEPKNPEIFRNLSAVQLANGNAKDAVATAKLALQLQVSPEVYVTLGAAYEKLGNTKSALIAYQRAQDLGKNDSALADKIQNLQGKK